MWPSKSHLEIQQRVESEEALVCHPRCHSGQTGQGLGLQKMTKCCSFCDMPGLFLSPNCAPIMVSSNAVTPGKPVAWPGRKL